MKNGSENSEFDYLITKISEAEFTNNPFQFLLLEDFLSEEHFNEITKAKEVDLQKKESTEELIDELLNTGYEVQNFPGCTTDIKDYLSCYNSNNWPVDKGILEGFGLTFRLKKIETPLIDRLYKFLNSERFKNTLENKFGLKKETKIETGIQKYLHGYEISPHPDIRKKALTYMLNINTHGNSENISIHTYLMKFKPEREYIYSFWQNNENIDRCWVPWSWCESVLETSVNNSIVIFAPSNDTLHAVKLDYDHLLFQRTQLYGNLWYVSDIGEYELNYNDIDLLKLKRKKEHGKNWKSYIPTGLKRVYRKIKN